MLKVFLQALMPLHPSIGKGLGQRESMLACTLEKVTKELPLGELNMYIQSMSKISD